MLISHRHRFIYTKTIKTAGTSVEIYFEEACIPPGSDIVRGHGIAETVTEAGVIGYRGVDPGESRWYNHLPASNIRELAGPEIWDSYFKFCVIRNPFDKLVSLWWAIIGANERYAEIIRDFSSIKAEFASWCVEAAANAVDRDKYLIDGQVAVDDFIRYESLMADLERVCIRIGYPFRPARLGQYKSGLRLSARPSVEYYDELAAQAVYDAFRWELDYFGYTGPSEDCQQAIVDP
ncbi:MAG TPA: hypothetical protein VKQ27_17570 [Acetobacteraceae bacterium]|nr:hypothetical protein [Acetobacteraceae bacterium]